jgi:hypothetical protein
VDRVVALDDVRVDVAMMRTPDGHSRLEQMKFRKPLATTAEPNAPANTLGIRRIMVAVGDIEDGPCPPAGPWRRTHRRGGAVRGQISALLRPRPRGHHRRSGRAAQLSVRPTSVLDPRERAVQLVDKNPRSFEPGKFEDHYGTALKELGEEKTKGHTTFAKEAERPAGGMEALKRSIGDAGAGKGKAARGGKNRAYSRL